MFFVCPDSIQPPLVAVPGINGEIFDGSAAKSLLSVLQYGVTPATKRLLYATPIPALDHEPALFLVMENELMSTWCEKVSDLT